MFILINLKIMPPKNADFQASHGDILIEYPSLKRAALVLRAASHPLRKQIINLLDEKKKLPVTDIYVKLREDQSVVSQHLAVLRKAGIVNAEKNGKFVFYTLDRNRIAEIGNFVAKLTNPDSPINP